MRTEGKCVAVMETCAKGLRQEKACCFQHDGPGEGAEGVVRSGDGD